MNRRAIISVTLAVLVLLCFSLGAAHRTVANEAKPIPADQIRPVAPPFVSGAKDYCFLDYTDWSPAYYWDQWKYGDKVAIYFDPEDCGWPQNYPFQLTDVHFYLYDHAGIGACSLRFSVEVVCPDICDGPGIEIWKSSTYYITTFYPDLAEVYFDDTVCLDKPFFFNVEFLQGPQGQVPSLLWDTQMVDDCYQWLWFGQPAWYEWHEFWGPGTPGWVCLGVSGYCGEEQTDCGWWYWKPDTLPQAPSGMPDFDQNQRDWVAYCGPTAVANCLWWFDAVPTAGMDPADFIELLAGYFGTTASGTYVDSIQVGLERYFDDYGFALTETTYWMPDFHEMEDSLKKCQDIILLLGFWWYAEGTEQEFIRGDINADGAVDLQDIVICQGGPPFPCMDAADVNDDGVFNTLDCDYLYNYYFSGGPPPPPPFPDCGVDPTPDGLDCQSFPPCPGGGGEWYREGGHFVTMAGVNSEKKEIAISDPDRDQVVRYPWWPGRVRLADHPPWGGYPPDFHNDPNYVSHDIYISLLYPEFPSPGSDIWDLADYCYGQTFPLMNVPHRFEAYSREAPKHYEYFHTEVEAAIMICPEPGPDTLKNHFKTWQVEPRDTLITVVVEDQFMQDDLTLDRIDFLSNPTRKDSFEIVDIFEHLTWYRAQGRDTLLEVEYTNQFGTFTDRIDSVKYLLLPTAKEVPEPFPEELDHYKAYRIKDPVEFDRQLELEDQFDIMFGYIEFIEILKPTYFLTPAVKNYEEPLHDSVTHYVAYEIYPQHFYELILVPTFDQFGERFLRVDTSKFLLVPTVKLGVQVPNHPPEIGQPDFLEGYVDDIVSYEITGSDPDGDVILDEASIDIQPGCGTWDIVRTSGHGTSTGTWEITWTTEGCTPCDTHMVIHDLTDEHGLVGYCTTYVHLSERDDSLWYWKPDTTWAPSGMPDFDQNQAGWIAYCGPTAVANCLWWYNAVPAGWTPPQLIDTLARYFHTNPAWGTYVDTMQMGLEQYFQDYGFAFQESTFHMPDFYEMEDSLKRCQDIILLLGFWFYDIPSEQWYREGGHFVTMAGVCSESLRIAISDPDADRAVAGWPGRVRPLTHPPAGTYPPTLHNNPTYVSHDMFNSILDSPFPSPGNPFWELDYPWWMKKGEFAGFNVPQEFRNVTRRAPPGDKQIFATEVEYAVMICPKEERECDVNDPKECDTLYVECGNMLVPPGGGLVTVDMTIAFDESLTTFQVPLSYEGSPICCDSMPDDENTTDKVFAGSIVPGSWIRIVNIDHPNKKVVVAGTAIVPNDCLMPGRGHLGTLTLFGDSCCTIQPDTTDWTGGVHVGFVECNDPSSTFFYPVVRIDTCHIDRNYPPVIGQPDFLEGYVDDVVQYDITGTDPDGDVINDTASIDIQPGCGDYSITRTSGHGTSSGTWQVTWNTDGCTPCDTHMVIHDLTDEHGATAYCTTWVHLSEEFDTTWYWKDPYEDYAPNGMPDIDQRQDGWMKVGTDQWSFCGPAAVANCFKWFDSKYNDVAPGFPGDGIDQFPLVRDYLDDLGPLVGYDDHDPWNVDHVGTPWGPAIGPPPATAQPFVPGPQVPGGGLPPWGELVERLAWFFNTDGIQTGYCEHTGTDVMEMQAGIQEWLESERFADAVPQFIRGDIDGDGNVNMTDAVACAAGGPFACDDAADVNDDGVLDMADCTYLTNYLTAGGPAPPMPFPDCGKDPSADALGCNHCPACPWSNTLADLLCEVTTPMPSFAYVESLVHKCEDVILLLGFWFEEDPQQFIRGDVNADGLHDIADIAALIIGPPYICDDAADVNDDGALNSLDSAYLWDHMYAGGPQPPPPFPNCGVDPTFDNLGCAGFPPCPGGGGWVRIGGHYVTVAGVNSEHFKIAFSDPFVDNAEFGAPGRVGDGTIIPHDFPHDPTVHNDEGNVSHDIYDVVTPSVSPGGEWWLPGYAVNGDPGYWLWNFYNQNVPEEFEPMTAPWNGFSPIHTEVEYCVHISPWDYRGDANNDGIVNVGDVVYLIAFLYRGGPAPVPMSVGDVNCDGIVDVGDVVFLINYLYRNGPVPRCCDP